WSCHRYLRPVERGLNPLCPSYPLCPWCFFISLVTSLRRMHFLEIERLLVHDRRRADAGELPRRDIRVVRIVAERFAVRRLAFFAEVSAARFTAFEGIQREQFGELQVIGDAAGVFEAL